MKLTPDQITIFILSIGIMLFFAKMLGEIFTKFKQPGIIGEILAGIILGPTIFGMIFPDIFQTIFPSVPEIEIALDGITTLAVVMLLLVLGIEVDLSIVLKQGKTALFTSWFGILVPFGLGFGVSYFFPVTLGNEIEEHRLVFALFMGTAMSISALPVIARTLMDLNIFKTKMGLIIITAAMLNDVMGWIIFSIILGMIGAGTHGFSFGETIALTSFFIFFVLFVGRRLINRALPWIQSKLSYPGGVINFILIVGLFGAAFTEFIGVHAIFGAFIMGIAIGDSVHLKEKTREIIHQFITNIFAPLFFVSIGLKVNFIENFDLVLVLVVLVIAFAGKVIGCGFGAYWGGLKKNEALVVGFGMNSRGAMEIILGILALQFGLIMENVFVALVIMALFTSLTSAPLMNIFLKERKRYAVKKLINTDEIILSSSNTKWEVIKELSQVIAEKNQLNASEIFEEVKNREELSHTGVGNFIAIPHARMNIKKPYAAIAVNKNGVVFDVNDLQPVHLIVLLLTPSDESELQLQIIAEIANAFGDEQKISAILKSDDIKKEIENIIS